MFSAPRRYFLIAMDSMHIVASCVNNWKLQRLSMR
jgi:hypothetical protein